MNVGERLNEALKFTTVFTIKAGKWTIPITETVIWSWITMLILVVLSLVLTRGMKKIPHGMQSLLESGVEFLNNLSAGYFGKRAGAFGPYIGTLFLFLIVANIIPAFTPITVLFRGTVFSPLFEIKPPARDINLTAALALITISLVIGSGFAALGFKGFFKKLLYPVPMMLPFNLLEYIIKPLSLCLRLFGNMLGSYIIMVLVDSIVPAFIPPFASLYFDFFDGFIQALVFTFLTILYINEAIEKPE